MIEQIKVTIKEKLEAYYKEKYSLDLAFVVETPKKPEMGDISVPMFVAVKALRRPMPELVAEAIDIGVEAPLDISPADLHLDHARIAPARNPVIPHRNADGFDHRVVDLLRHAAQRRA